MSAGHQPDGTDLTKLLMDAAVAANDLLQGGVECIPILLEYAEKPTASEAILIAAHALIAQRDMHNEENRAEQLRLLENIAEKLGDIAESLDFIAATKPDSVA